MWRYTEKHTQMTTFVFETVYKSVQEQQFDPMYVYLWPRKITVWSATFIQQSFHASIKRCGMMIEKGQENGTHT